jgi:hypothetical protein
MYIKKKQGAKRPYIRKSRGKVANSRATDTAPVPDGLVFYCRSCEHILDFHPKTFGFKAPLDCCQKEKSTADEVKKKKMTCDVVYGTERSIKHYYRVSDAKLDVERKENEDKAARADKL